MEERQKKYAILSTTDYTTCFRCVTDILTK